MIIKSKYLKWLIMVGVLLSLTACSSENSNARHNNAQVEKIANYAKNEDTAPTVKIYKDAGIIGVTEDNLSQINEAVSNLKYEDVDTSEEIQALFDRLDISIKTATPDTKNSLKVITVYPSEITETSVKIHWELSDNTTGEIEYGKTKSYGQKNTKERSFKYKVHTQPITGLESNTTYHYRVISEDRDGKIVMSKDKIFKTLAKAVDAKSIPKKYPYIHPSDGKNLYSKYNGDFSGSENWTLTGAASIDTTKSVKKDGSGSLKIGPSDSSAVGIYITLKAHKLYTVKFKMMTDSSSGLLNIHGKVTGSNLIGSAFTTSKPNVWEEKYLSLRMPIQMDIDRFSLVIARNLYAGKGNIWIDDVEIVEGIEVQSLPQKQDFDKGGAVKIDELGNFNINGMDVFPMYIYGSSRYFKTWKERYTDQGFDGIMWVHTSNSIKTASRAGLRTGWEMSWYVVKKSETPNRTLTQFREDLQSAKDAGMLKYLSFFYWDNEFYHNEPYVKKLVKIAHKIAPKIPHYMLNGQFGMSSYYDFVDVMGTYVSRDGAYTYDKPKHTYPGEPLIENIAMANHASHAKAPFSIAQMNLSIGNRFNAVLFGAIAHGAKGMGVWRDGNNTIRTLGTMDEKTKLTPVNRVTDITELPWYKNGNLKNIRKNINKMLSDGIIQSTHLNTFRVNPKEDTLYAGTKVVNNQAYVIVSNPTNTFKNVELDYSGLHYHPSALLDYLDNDKEIGSFTDTTMTIPVPACIEDENGFISPSCGYKVIKVK